MDATRVIMTPTKLFPHQGPHSPAGVGRDRARYIEYPSFNDIENTKSFALSPTKREMCYFSTFKFSGKWKKVGYVLLLLFLLLSLDNTCFPLYLKF